MRLCIASWMLAALFTGLFAVAQETAPNALAPNPTAPSSSTSVSVPRLVRFSGVAKDTDSKPLTGAIGITFMLYKDQQGGAPLWMETQNVQADSSGHYSVQLGSTLPEGLPADLFASNEARWLATQISGQAEQARVLLVSVPYALKALDAETLGGRPASAYVQANPETAALPVAATSSKAPSTLPQAVPAISGSGKANYITEWKSTSSLEDSALYQTSAGNIGLATTSPSQKLEVDSGNFMVKGTNNFKTAGQNAFVYVGDTNHPIEAINAGGLALGTYLVPEAVYIADKTGNVGIGTTSPGYPLVVVSSGASNAGLFTGFSAASNSGLGGGVGATFTGGNADPKSSQATGAAGVVANGGYSASFATAPDGPGGIFTGGNGGQYSGGDGVDAYAGSGAGVVAVGGDSIEQSVNVSDGIDAYAGSEATAFAGYFLGDLYVTGAIFAGTKDFKIDHPQDPANKYLVHATVESSEMMNIYSGNVTTDNNGIATVHLPKWFEAINADFRYQLTPIGQFAQAIVGSEIHDSQFSIRTDKPNVKVSWQVSGVRQDAFAKTHPLVVEQTKEPRLRGFYIHPELYGAPAEKQIEWARHPTTMKRIQEHRAKMRSQAKQTRTVAQAK